MKVLISAYACEPHKGSEPGVGWNWVRQIARFHEVWVITRANNQPFIEKALEPKPQRNVHWIFFDLPGWMRFWKKGGRGVFLYNFLWQIGSYFLAKKLHRQVHFDLTHHITFGNYRYPSFLPWLNIPFVWGPLGGGDTVPGPLLKTLPLRGRFYEALRSASLRLVRIDPFVRFTIKKAALVIARTQETAGRLKSLGAGRVQIYSESGILTAEIPERRNEERGFTRFVSIGALLAFKGYHLSIKAFKEFNQVFPESEYWIIGDGPERGRLQTLVSELGLQEKIRFFGNIPRESVLQKLAESHVMVHPSLHDAGPWAILEAMACGLPLICFDLGGPALQVTEGTGFKIPAISPEQAVRDMAEAMLKLAANPQLARQMGEAGRKRVAEHFSWEGKGEFIRRVYQDVLGEGERE